MCAHFAMCMYDLSDEISIFDFEVSVDLLQFHLVLGTEDELIQGKLGFTISGTRAFQRYKTIKID